jgi:hypothetical protein
MTPKEKANELFGKYYSRIEHTLSEEYSPHERFIVKQCALIAVDEIIDSEPQYEWSNDYWKNPNDFWQEVKQEIEKL